MTTAIVPVEFPAGDVTVRQLKVWKQDRDNERLVNAITTVTGQAGDLGKKGLEMLQAGLANKETQEIVLIVLLEVLHRLRVMGPVTAGMLIAGLMAKLTWETLTPWPWD